jgi:hypothetical protein
MTTRLLFGPQLSQERGGAWVIERGHGDFVPERIHERRRDGGGLVRFEGAAARLCPDRLGWIWREGPRCARPSFGLDLSAGDKNALIAQLRHRPEAFGADEI